MSQLLTVPCPTCKKTVIWGAKSPQRPFCSAHCKLLDLGAWAAQEHKIAGDPVSTDQLYEDTSEKNE